MLSSGGNPGTVPCLWGRPDTLDFMSSTDSSSADSALEDDVLLRDAHASAQLGPYLSDLWDRRAYVRYTALNELKQRQITNVLGNLWHLLNPALSIAVYFLIFGLLLETDRGVDNFLLFLTIGLFVFQFTQKATIDGAKSIINNKGVIKAVKFPRVMLPLSSTTVELLGTIPSYIVLYGVAILSGEEFAFRWIALVPLLALQALFSFGAAMFAARAATHFSDITQILPFFFRLLFYGSGVIFSVDAYVDGDNALVSALFVANPMYCFLSLGRWSILGGEFPGTLLLSAVLWTIALVIGGFFWFRAAEERYARD